MASIHHALPAWTALLLAPLVVADATASDEPTDPRCGGPHGLWSPLPDECLGVIDTDRPHQTDTPHVVPAGHVQIESAVAALQVGADVDDRGGPRKVHLVLFDDEYRFGVASHVDVEMLFKHSDYVPALKAFAPPGPLSVRAKWNFVEGGGAVPALTFVPWVFLPVAPVPAESLRAGPLLFLAWELPLHLELEVNAGVLFSEKPKPAEALVLASALTYSIGANFGVFVDAYATGWDVALGTGALWAFARDMQIDVGTYVGLSGQEPAATPFVGFSVRR
jgi:outer membrane putative beta-barrel porin/alpha-amylase